MVEDECRQVKIVKCTLQNEEERYPSNELEREAEQVDRLDRKMRDVIGMNLQADSSPLINLVRISMPTRSTTPNQMVLNSGLELWLVPRKEEMEQDQ